MGIIGLLICGIISVVFSSQFKNLINSFGNTAAAEAPDYKAVVYENIRASNAEDVDAYMATIHPDSPAYASTREMLATIFQNYDLKYSVSGLNVLEETSREVRLSFVLITQKIRGPDFRDNKITGVMVLRKDGDKWKIYDQTVDKIDYY